MFDINLNFIIFSTLPEKNSQYILSTSQDEILIPNTKLDTEWLGDLDKSIIGFLKSNYIFVSDYELMPQIINFHCDSIESKNNQINTVYGFIVSHTKSLNNCFWIPFDYLTPHKYSGIIFETIQKLK